MNTLTKGFAKRVLSMLLVTIMVFSLGLVGITSASAAEVEMAETGYLQTDTLYCFNSYTNSANSGQWSVDSSVAMTWNSTYSLHEFHLDNISPDNTIYFRFYCYNKNEMIHAADTTVDITSNVTYKNNSNWSYTPSYTSNTNYVEKNWKLNLSTNFSEYDTVDVYLQMKNTGVMTVYVTDGVIDGEYTDVVQLAGSFTDWANSAITLDRTGTTDWYETTVDLEAGSYEFKMIVGTTWYGNSGTINDTTDATSTSGWEFTTSAGNCTLTASGGKYTFQYNRSTNKLIVLYNVNTVEVTSVTAKLDSDTIKLGQSATITATAVIDGEPESLTYTLNTNGTAGTAQTSNVFTVTPESAGTYKYTVTVTADDSILTSAEVTLTVEQLVLVPSVSPASQTGYLGSTFEVLASYNSAEIVGTATYEFKDAEGNLLNEGTTSLPYCEIIPATAGTHEYTVTVTVGEYTEDAYFTITVEEFTGFTFTCKAPESVEAGQSIVINASTATTFPVTYTLTKEDGSTLTSTNGRFEIPTDGMAVGTVLNYTVTAAATYNGTEVPATNTANLSITITEISETHNVAIYFKATDTLGYRPVATVKSSVEEKSEAMTKAELIVNKVSGTATYWWYKIDVEVSTVNPEVNFNIVLGSSYDMEHDYTFNATGSEYWLAVDNLNTNTTTDKDGNVYTYEVIDVTQWPEAMRNWTESAVHMLWDEELQGTWGTELAATSYYYTTVSVGDANGDGKVNVRDATLIQKNLAKMAELSVAGTKVSDVNFDGNITIKDATAIQKAVAGL